MSVIWLFIGLFGSGCLCRDRLDRLEKDYNLAKLDVEWEDGDEIELRDLPHWDPRKPDLGIDTSKVRADDHVTTFAEAKKGQELGLYIKTVPNMTPSEVGLRFDIWQENMVNCCQFELKWKSVGSSIMLVLLPDGLHLREFADMLRKDDACFSFMVENIEMLCRGHPDWDEDRPGRNLEGMKWEKKQADQAKTEKRKRASVWKKGL